MLASPPTRTKPFLIHTKEHEQYLRRVAIGDGSSPHPRVWRHGSSGCVQRRCGVPSCLHRTIPATPPAEGFFTGCIPARSTKTAGAASLLLFPNCVFLDWERTYLRLAGGWPGRSYLNTTRPYCPKGDPDYKSFKLYHAVAFVHNALGLCGTIVLNLKKPRQLKLLKKLLPSDGWLIRTVGTGFPKKIAVLRKNLPDLRFWFEWELLKFRLKVNWAVQLQVQVGCVLQLYRTNYCSRSIVLLFGTVTL